MSYIYSYHLPCVNVRVCVSAGIVFRLKFASRTGHFRVEGEGGTSGLNTGWCEFSLFSNRLACETDVSLVGGHSQGKKR